MHQPDDGASGVPGADAGSRPGAARLCPESREGPGACRERGGGRGVEQQPRGELEADRGADGAQDFHAGERVGSVAEHVVSWLQALITEAPPPRREHEQGQAAVFTPGG